MKSTLRGSASSKAGLLFGRLAILVALCSLAWTEPRAIAQNDPASRTVTLRLFGLAQLWATVKYFHPFLAHRPDIDWDQALLDAIPKARLATTSDDYAAAVRSMLTALGDPMTSVVNAQPPPGPTSLRPPSYARGLDGIILVSTGDYSSEQPDFATLGQTAASAASSLETARGVIFDLRSRTKLPAYWSGLTSIAFLQANQLAKRLSSTAYFTPGQRIRTPVLLKRSGRALVSDGQADFQVTQARPITPVGSARDIPVVFIVNAHSDIPSEAFALQAQGKAGIVAEGDVTESSRVMTTHVDVSEGVVVRVRLGELVFPGGVSLFRPDAVVAEGPHPSDSDAALFAAHDLVGRLPRTQTAAEFLPARGMYRSERSFDTNPYPDIAQRLLGAFRVWAAFKFLAPYKELIDEDWDAVLRTSIPEIEQAQGPLAYHLVMAELLTHTHDSHTVVQSAVLGEHFGIAAPPVRVRVIEGRPVITGFRDEAAAHAAGTETGAVILSVDGEPAADRLQRYARYVSASTPQARMREAADREFPLPSTGGFLCGAPGSIATLTVRTVVGETRTLRLPRKTEFSSARNERTGPILSVLPGGVGYVDINRLTPVLADEAFERFANAPGIIFDSRGYPVGGVTTSLAERLTTSDHTIANLSYSIIPSAPGNSAGIISTLQTSATRLRIAENPYRGRTVMLIDERTQSAGEDLAMAFKAANNTTFIGSRSAGANGNMISFPAAAGIVFSFTGIGVKHGDGRQLQRVGLIPDVEATPTIRGIQEGHDEVLEAALVYLKTP